ncbi:MAG: hypothetical protein ACI8W0_002040, partial [Flavobacterium sp.]
MLSPLPFKIFPAYSRNKQLTVMLFLLKFYSNTAKA